MRAKKHVLDNSSCHTLDRANLRAQKDICGIGKSNEEWRFAVDQQFNVTHWPYIQSSSNYHCVQSFFEDSYINMSVDSARMLALSATVILGLIHL